MSLVGMGITAFGRGGFFPLDLHLCSKDRKIGRQTIKRMVRREVIMRARFFYSEEEIKRAVLAHHERKITFSPRAYETEIEFDGKEAMVLIKEKDKEPSPVSVWWGRISNKWRWART